MLRRSGIWLSVWPTAVATIALPRNRHCLAHFSFMNVERLCAVVKMGFQRSQFSVRVTSSGRLPL